MKIRENTAKTSQIAKIVSCVCFEKGSYDIPLGIRYSENNTIFRWLNIVKNIVSRTLCRTQHLQAIVRKLC